MAFEKIRCAVYKKVLLLHMEFQKNLRDGVMATFRTTAKDGHSLPFVFQSSQSHSSEPLVTIEFRNHDEDSGAVYSMARLSVGDARPGAIDGFGSFAIETASNGVLARAVEITDGGAVQIGGLLSVSTGLDVSSNVAVGGGLRVSQTAVARRLVVLDADVAAAAAGRATAPGGGAHAVAVAFRRPCPLGSSSAFPVAAASVTAWQPAGAEYGLRLFDPDSGTVLGESAALSNSAPAAVELAVPPGADAAPSAGGGLEVHVRTLGAAAAVCIGGVRVSYDELEV